MIFFLITGYYKLLSYKKNWTIAFLTRASLENCLKHLNSSTEILSKLIEAKSLTFQLDF